MLREIVAPYLLWIKLGALALAVGLCVRGGCVMQRHRDDAKITALNARLGQKDAALDNAARVLRGSRDAIREINAEAGSRIAASKREADAFEQAGKVADVAKQKAEQNAAALQRQIDRAKSHNPACTALMESNMEGVCAAVLVR